MAATALPGTPAAGQAAGGDMLALWAEATGRRRPAGPGLGGLRSAFCGRVSTEDWQDPVTSRARQREQAAVLVAGHGLVVAEFFDSGESRTLPWARRPQAAALVARMVDPDRGWDAIVVGEFERAFYGNQYASMAPLFEHYGIQLWMPEVGGRVDWHAEPAYRCRHGYTSATRPDPGRAKNTYVREDQILPHLATVAILLSGDQATRNGSAQVIVPAEAADLIDQLRASGTVLTYESDTHTIRAGDSGMVTVTTGQSH